MDQFNRLHNYQTPKNYHCVTIPDSDVCHKIRSEGVPYPGCKRYSIAFKLNEDMSPGAVIKGWEGYAYECPCVPAWDEEGPWSILQTEILTGE